MTNDTGFNADQTRSGEVVAMRRRNLQPTYVDDFSPDERLDDPVGFDFWKTFRVLVRRRLLILAILAAGFGVTTVLTLRVTPLYRALATIEIQKQETQIIQGGNVAPIEIADSEFMATQFALLKSNALAERVAEVLDLPADPRYASPSASRDARLKQASEKIIRNLSVAPIARSRVVGITYVSPFPEESARIANAVAENFIESNLERKFNATAYARTFLEDRLKSTKTALEASERQLVDYARKYNIIDLGGSDASEVSGSLDASSLKALSAALTTAQDARISAEQKYLEARSNPSTLQTISNERIVEIRTRRSVLAAEYQEKKATFKADFPDMVELQARIDALDREVEQERASIIGALQAEYNAALARENSLKARVLELSGSLQTERGSRIEYNILRRGVDTNRSQYEALLQRLKEVSISSGVANSQVAIVDRAKTPAQPFSPNFRANLLRGLIFSLILAIAIAFALDYIDDTIKLPEDVSAKLGLPCIGVLPKTDVSDGIADILNDPRSHLAEAFASARTALQFSTPSGAPRCILVTGTRPGEGKTSAVLGLAMSFAGTGRRVLIIDGDMRRPSFTSPDVNNVGLSGLLTGKAEFSTQIVPGSVANLFLLPSGIVPPNPAELLSSPLLHDIIASAKAQFDIVFVDSAPVLSFADAPMLASACDGTIVVIQAGALRRQAIQRTIERLQAARAHFLGVLLSKFDVKNETYGYGYGYGYGESDPDKNSARRSSEEERLKRRIGVFVDAAPPSRDHLS